MRIQRKFLIAAGALAGMLAATPALAQDGYTFGMPRVSLALRLGAASPAASGELFQFFTEELTLDRDDFTSLAFNADIGVRVAPRIDLILGVGVDNSSSDSNFRDFVEDNGTDDEIRQTTEFTRVPVTAGVKLYLLPRGRSISRYAFIPTRFSPYVGGGAGVMWYDLKQYGDFVDFETLDIFSDHFESDGAAFTANAFAGGEMWIKPWLGVNVEGRYNWARADLDDAFSDFDEIDLKGWQLTAGLSLRY